MARWEKNRLTRKFMGDDEFHLYVKISIRLAFVFVGFEKLRLEES